MDRKKECFEKEVKILSKKWSESRLRELECFEVSVPIKLNIEWKEEIIKERKERMEIRDSINIKLKDLELKLDVLRYKIEKNEQEFDILKYKIKSARNRIMKKIDDKIKSLKNNHYSQQRNKLKFSSNLSDILESSSENLEEQKIINCHEIFHHGNI